MSQLPVASGPLPSPPWEPSASARWRRVESLLDRASDRLNPILVKEARQAMKSRQFVVTFSLLLVCAWGWSFLGVAMRSPAIYYAPGGRYMLVGYYYVLAFPLLVIVPFGAFRSLASERDDGTYELLSISTLSPGQIVGGKLGSAILQMLVYLSALSPCVAFTYLLGGVDVLLLALVLILVSLGSLFLSALGLLLATLTNARHWQVILAVATIVGLVVGFIYFSFVITLGVIGEQFLPLDQTGFWVGAAVFMTAYVSLFTLIILAAAANITFASDNRSTRLRIAMLVQYILLVAWLMGFWLAFPSEEEILFTFLFLSAVHWYVMGAFMTGESPHLSPRVRRHLPETFLGRVFLTWFFPGPGKGYFYAVASMCSASLLVLLCLAQPIFAASLAQYANYQVITPARFGTSTQISMMMCAFILLFYLIIYLGVGRLLVGILSRWFQTSVVASFLLNLILVALGALVPLVVQFSFLGVVGGADDYTTLQVPNLFWTLTELLDRNNPVWESMIVLAVVAFAVFSVNLLISARDVIHPRTPVPARVQEDELELHPEKMPLPPGPTSPWDDDA